jgi:hypothetical protein
MTSRPSRIVSLILALAAAGSTENALAQVARLSNSVSCPYEALGSERREIGQYLALQAMTANINPVDISERPGELMDMINDGMDACLKVYPWTAGKSKNAALFTVTNLFKDVMHSELDRLGHPVDKLDAFLATRRSTIRFDRPPSRALETELIANLRANGWKFTDKDSENIPLSYYRAWLMGEYLTYAFGLNVFYRFR